MSLDRSLGRYLLCDEIASGGMATVHLGRLVGDAGFSRTVAIKRLHSQFAKDPDFVSMFMDEARLAARIHDPNVIATLDVVSLLGELFLVMEYVPGESLAALARVLATSDAHEKRAIDPSIAVAIVVGALHGLAAAHAATDEGGEPLHIVHRDVSPQNILVGADGVARLLDFGVAKAVGRLQSTHEGQVKGKSAYMAPEQVRGREVDARTDVYAAAVVSWEALTGDRLFFADNSAGVMSQVLDKVVRAPSEIRASIPKSLDAVVLRGLSRKPENRFQTAREMVAALEQAITPATAREVKTWVAEIASANLAARAAQVARVEERARSTSTPPPALTAKIPTPAPIEISQTSTAIMPSQAIASDVTAIDVTVREPVVIGESPKRRNTGKLAAILIAASVLSLAVIALAIYVRSSPTASVNAEPAASSSDDSIVFEVQGASSGANASTSASADPPKPRSFTRTRGGAKPRAVDCDPPYTIDANGIRRPKAKCL